MLENCLDSCSRHAAFVASATKFDLRDKAWSGATGSIYLCALIATAMFLCISSNHLRPAWQVRYIGLSNETTYGVCEFARAAAAAGLPAPVSIQNSYSLLARVLFEADLAEACAPHHHNLGAHYPNPQIDYDLHLVFCNISSAYVHTYDTNMSVLDSHSPHSYTTNRNATSTMLPKQRLLGVHARTRLSSGVHDRFQELQSSLDCDGLGCITSSGGADPPVKQRLGAMPRPHLRQDGLWAMRLWCRAGKQQQHAG